MGRYLSIVVLGIGAALSASVIPQGLALLSALAGEALPFLSAGRGQLNLVMLLVLCWSLHATWAECAIWALVGGIALDLLSVLPPGATSAALLLLVYAVKQVSSPLMRARVALLLTAAAAGTIFLLVYTWLALAILGYRYDLLAMIQLTLLPSALINMAAVLPVYAGVRLMQRRMDSGLQVSPQMLAAAGNRRRQA